MEGIIANIRNKYVILNVMGYIEQTPLYYKLLPNDIVEYEKNDGKIKSKNQILIKNKTACKIINEMQSFSNEKIQLSRQYKKMSVTKN